MDFYIENGELKRIELDLEDTHVIIPDSVTSFGERVFQNCINLAGFTIRNANIVIQIPESVRLIA